MELENAFRVKGYDQLDLLETSSAERDFSYEAGEGFRMIQSDDFGIGVRAVVKGKVGHAFANRHEDVLQAVKSAIKFAKYSNLSIDLDKYGSYKKPENVYDSKLMRREDSDFLDQLNALIELAKQEKCSVMAISSSAGESNVRYLNSEGADLVEKYTGFGASWELEHNGNPCAYGVENVRFAPNLSKEFSKTCEFARLQAKKIQVKTAPMDVIFHHFIVPGILDYSLIPSLSAKTVQQGKSKLAGKVGEKLFSDKLSVVDDGLLANGLGSRSFDSEGVPCKKTSLIEKGVLKGYMYDLARAKKDGVEPTGNGVRTYASAADISPTNFVLPKGNKDLVKEVDSGLLLYSALNVHSVDAVSGNFSVGACPGFVIKKGEIVGAVRKAMLSGNVYDILAKIKALGRDRVSLAGGMFGGAMVVSPSILSECLVVGE